MTEQNVTEASDHIRRLRSAAADLPWRRLDKCPGYTPKSDDLFCWHCGFIDAVHPLSAAAVTR